MTQDLGVLVDGELCVWGRADDIIVCRGRNVSARDMEQTGTEVRARVVRAAIQQCAGAGPESIVQVQRSTLPRTPSAKRGRHLDVRMVDDLGLDSFDVRGPPS